MMNDDKKDRNDEGNYRPVSILPVASKVLENIVYNQMQNYLEQNNLIYAFQSGRKQVVKINGRVSTAGKITCGVLQDSILDPLLFNIQLYMSMT